MTDPRIRAVRRRHHTLLGLALTLVVAPSALLALQSQPALTPTEKQSQISAGILTELLRSHFRVLAIDDEFSAQLLDRYLKSLDPSRLFFLADDIKSIDRFRSRFDDDLRRGKLDAAFLIFERFQERRRERTEFLLRLLEEELAELRFDGTKLLQIDRSNAPWPASEEEAEGLWRDRFLNDVLSLRLADREPEQIHDVLQRRYKNQELRIKQINRDDVFRLFMNIVTESFDPHTQYFPPRDSENFDIQMRLSFQGIGALLTSEGEFCKISRIIPGGPAERGGILQAGDRIIAVGQEDDEEMVDIVGWRVDEAVDLIRGPKDSRVRLAILSEGQNDLASAREIVIVRDQVKLEEQAASKKILEVERKGQTLRIGVIDLPAFYMDFEAARRGDPDYRSSTRDVARLVEELKAEGVDGLVMDLRRNGGGSLQEATELTGLFLGAVPVVQIQGTGNRGQVLRSPTPEPLYTGPLAVLVDRLSASASEIFAGAVQDYGRGVVLGTRTFGKGTVQGFAPLPSGDLKLTHAKFYRVSGASTQNRGVEPDILFPPVYDPEEIGESTQATALPWDRIKPVEYERDESLTESLSQMREHHEQRSSQDAGFQRIRERLQWADEVRSITHLSLNEEVRRTQQKEQDKSLLEIENRALRARGEEPVASLEDLPARLEDSDLDAYAREAAEILADSMTLSARTRRDMVHRRE